MAKKPPELWCPAHWRQRCVERGVGVDPALLWHDIRRALREGREDFARRRGKTRGGRLLVIFSTSGGVFGAVVDPETLGPITVLAPGMVVKRPKPSRRKRAMRRIRA